MIAMDRLPWGGVLFCCLLLVGGPGCRFFPKRQSAEPIASQQSQSIARSATETEPTFTVISQQVEQPAGNEYLTRGIWKDATDPISHELSTLLAANGLRVGVIRGQTPPELERLGTSTASSVGLIQRSFVAGKSRTIPINGPADAEDLRITNNLPNDVETHSLRAADYGVEVVGTPTENGHVRVRCTLTIQHGDQQGWLVPNSDGTGFMRKEERPAISLGKMTWELTLGRTDILLIGSTEAPAGTLGQAYFYMSYPDRQRQRVFVLQAGANANSPGEVPANAPGFAPSASIAAQAWRTPRRTAGIITMND